MEVHEENAVDSLEIEHPIWSFSALVSDGTGEVIDRPFLEVPVSPILHFYDEPLAVLVLAVDVVNATSVVSCRRQLFLVEEGDVDNPFLALQQVVQEINKEVLVDLLPEDALEAHIRKWIDKSSHSYLIIS